MEDPLDSSDFDPVEYINQRFPTELSLRDLDTFTVGVQSQIAALDEEISKTVQRQSSAGQQATQDIVDAKSAIADLFEIIMQIKAKASQSEQMVQELCSDIKKLDCAKNHLQHTITSLKRLQMLLTAVTHLDIWRELPLKEVANMLEAVKQLMVHFEKYTDIPKIAQIKVQVGRVEQELNKHVRAAFREIGQLVESVADANLVVADVSSNMQCLSEACLVVDALGLQARKVRVGPHRPEQQSFTVSCFLVFVSSCFLVFLSSCLLVLLFYCFTVLLVY
jgi:hypothetical protein